MSEEGKKSGREAFSLCITGPDFEFKVKVDSMEAYRILRFLTAPKIEMKKPDLKLWEGGD